MSPLTLDKGLHGDNVSNSSSFDPKKADVPGHPQPLTIKAIGRIRRIDLEYLIALKS
jgi:hypothetical protein